MTENAETYILAFGGTILKEYKGVYLVSFPYNRDEIRYNNKNIPLVFCNNQNNNLPFLIRSPEGELTELTKEEIDALKKLPSFPSPNTTCTERKILGQFFTTYCNEIKKENNNDKSRSQGADKGLLCVQDSFK
jgi:hypothetical protein